MKELGIYLHDTRCSNGVSLEEAAHDLNVDEAYLENIESANVKAFKDMYYVRDLVKEYAKYLGLSEVMIQDEFNDFLFEHTSKISLNDIMEAKMKKETLEKDKKVKSPYTKEYKRKVKKTPFIVAGVVFFLIIIMAIIIIKTVNRVPIVVSELKGGKLYYEYTY